MYKIEKNLTKNVRFFCIYICKYDIILQIIHKKIIMSLDALNNWQDSETNIQKTEKLLPEVEKQLKWEVRNDSQEQLSQLNDTTMQTITHEDFLKYSPETRFQSLARNTQGEKITADQIISGEISDIKIELKFGADKINDQLGGNIMLGDILPKNISAVMSDGVEYTRKNLAGDFFDSKWRALKITHETSLNISWIRTQEDIEGIEKKNQEELKKATQTLGELLDAQPTDISPKDKQKLEQVTQKWVESGYNKNFIMELIAAFFIWLGKLEKTLDLGWSENWFAILDRKLAGKNQAGENIQKNNMTPAQQTEMINQVVLTRKPPEVTFTDYPQLDALADEYKIKRSILYAIWATESLAGANNSERPEDSWVTSYGMFQVLDKNFKDAGRVDLLNEIKQKPGDRDLNIEVLKMFLDNNHHVVSALRSRNYQSIAESYNGKWFKRWADKNDAIAYDLKLKYYEDAYKQWKNNK